MPAAKRAKTAKAPVRQADSPRHWLMKSEPDVCSFDDLWRAPKRTTGWDGVRNYQARNYMRDEMRVGDLVLFYHSNADPSGVAGIAEVASAPYPDPTQFDPASEYYDPKATKDAPIWMQVDVRAVERLPRFLPLDELKGEPKLDGMELLRRGSRLSVQPVSAAHFEHVRRLAAKR